MKWKFLDVDAIKSVHADLIQMYGGSHGIRDEGLLESAVKRAEMFVYYNESATVPQVAASVSFGLIKNHAFIDGNKRIGLAALVDFLALNDHDFDCPDEEQIRAVQQTAASAMTEAEWTAWVTRFAKPSL